jgi:hypothetical protein
MSVIIGNRQDRTIDGALRTLAGETTSLTPGAALGLLAEHAAGAKDPADRAKAIKGLAKALGDHADAQVRVGAAGALAGAATPAAINVLRAAISRSDDGELLGAASLALARTGTKSDVKRMVEGSERIQWKPGERRAAAAARLLAYRTGIVDDRATGRDAGLELLVRPVDGAKIVQIDIAAVTERVRVSGAEANLLPSGAKPVGAFACGPRRHLVMAPTTNKHVAELVEHPSVAAALLGINETTGTAFVRWLVLTRPATAADGPDRGAKGDLVVTVIRPTGEVGFLGRGRVDGDALSVDVAAVAAPGASAVELSGTLAGGKVVVTGIGDGRITVARNHPTAAPATNPGR